MSKGVLGGGRVHQVGGGTESRLFQVSVSAPVKVSSVTWVRERQVCLAGKRCVQNDRQIDKQIDK